MTSAVVPDRIALRAATDEDHAFLVGLYATTRDDLALLPPDQRDALMSMQYRAQDLQCRQANPDARYDVVEVAGRPIGRLYVDERTEDLHIIDISLLPERRGAGIGTELIRAVQDEAAASGRGVSLHVALGNPAAALYLRLGFRPVEDLGVYRRLEWSAT
ncbi:GNAT family N-acetyltransferase [Nocardioides sp. MH1]|uniref:GNAT family N-acetyltransferase n=1 Tax=Nocardioides sp. MH1 TaxID=3242490 RepID=UPI003520707E